METRWCRVCGELLAQAAFRPTRTSRRRTCRRCDSRRRMRARYMQRARPVPLRYLDPDLPVTTLRAILEAEHCERLTRTTP